MNTWPPTTRQRPGIRVVLVHFMLALILGLSGCQDFRIPGSEPSDRGASGADERSAYTGPKRRSAFGKDVRCFADFGKFKRAMTKEGMGTRGRDYHWHHIVPQHPRNKETFTEHDLHCTDNLVYIHKDEHTKLNRFYSRHDKRFGGKSFRDWLEPKSFEEQRAYGLETMRDLDIEITDNPGVSF